MANDAAACLSINLLLDTIEAMAITSFSSVNGNVTVPVGGSAATALLPPGHAPHRRPDERSCYPSSRPYASPPNHAQVLAPIVAPVTYSTRLRSDARWCLLP